LACPFELLTLRLAGLKAVFVHLEIAIVIEPVADFNGWLTEHVNTLDVLLGFEPLARPVGSKGPTL